MPALSLRSTAFDGGGLNFSAQAVPVSWPGQTLGFLGASNNGTASGTGTIVYLHIFAIGIGS